MSITATARLRQLIGFIVCAFILTTCSEKSPDIQRLEKIIMRYNELLVRGYAEMNMTPLSEVATTDQVQKVYHHMAALGESGVRLESERKDIDISDVQYQTENVVQVQTREIWNYYHVHINTKKTGKKIEGVVYDLTYTLNKEDGRWIIANVVSNAGSEK